MSKSENAMKECSENMQRNMINLYENKNQMIQAAVDKITVEIINRKGVSDSQVVLLTGCSAVTGTTSTCIGLSIAMANTSRRTLLIDCDVRKSAKYKKLNDSVTYGLADYLLDDEQNGTDISGAIYRTNIENLDYIPRGSSSDNATRILCSPKMEKLLEAARDQYECIILDFPALTIVPDALVYFPCVDGIVFLAALGETTKKQIKEARLRVAPYIDKYYGMIVNKIPLDMYRSNVKNYDYYLLDRNGEQKLSGSLARKKYKMSVREGRNAEK